MNNYSIDPFYALADPKRRAILMLLTQEKRTINTLAENFDISRPAVSKHIKVLCDAGFVSIENIGRERYCGLHPDGFNEVKDWVTYFEQFWKIKFTKLETLLNENANSKNKKK
jgi:DNA-binding transcriptional ArsR family regulator